MTSFAKVTQVIVLSAAALPRMAWSALLEGMPGLNTWGTAANRADVEALPETDGATAILIDSPQPPVTLVKELAATVPEYGLLCLVDNYDLDVTISLLQAGLTGSLVRDATTPELARALIAVGRGEIVLPPTLAARALSTLARGEISRPTTVEALTERERDVLELLAQGLTNKEIAQSLFLSVRTVEAHLRNIYNKLDVTSRTEAVLWAIQHGFEPRLSDFT